jgi:hypothetical protein
MGCREGRVGAGTVALIQAGWEVVKKPGETAERYAEALHYVERACHVEPDSGYYLQTRAVAQYRVGRYLGAVATLTHSDQTPSTAGGVRHPPPSPGHGVAPTRAEGRSPRDPRPTDPSHEATLQ